MLKFSSPKSLSAMVLSGKARSKALFNRDDFSNRNGSFQVPGGLVVKSPPSNAGHVGLIPDQGTKNPPAVGQLSPYGTTKPLWYNLAHALLTPPQQWGKIDESFRHQLTREHQKLPVKVHTELLRSLHFILLRNVHLLSVLLHYQFPKLLTLELNILSVNGSINTEPFHFFNAPWHQDLIFPLCQC